jgi:hypothetical protein
MKWFYKLPLRLRLRPQSPGSRGLHPTTGWPILLSSHRHHGQRRQPIIGMCIKEVQLMCIWSLTFFLSLSLLLSVVRSLLVCYMSPVIRAETRISILSNTVGRDFSVAPHYVANNVMTLCWWPVRSPLPLSLFYSPFLSILISPSLYYLFMLFLMMHWLIW